MQGETQAQMGGQLKTCSRFDELAKSLNRLRDDFWELKERAARNIGSLLVLDDVTGREMDREKDKLRANNNDGITIPFILYMDEIVDDMFSVLHIINTLIVKLGKAGQKDVAAGTGNPKDSSNNPFIGLLNRMESLKRDCLDVEDFAVNVISELIEIKGDFKTASLKNDTKDNLPFFMIMTRLINDIMCSIRNISNLLDDLGGWGL